MLEKAIAFLIGLFMVGVFAAVVFFALRRMWTIVLQ